MRTRSQDPAFPDEGLVTIPADPPPNYGVDGYVFLSETSRDNFRIVFNEHVFNRDGSLTINAVHEYFLGRILVGDAADHDHDRAGGPSRPFGERRRQPRSGDGGRERHLHLRHPQRRAQRRRPGQAVRRLSGTNLVSSSGATCATGKGKGGGLACDLGTISSGATKVVTVVAKAPAKSGTISATATVTSSAGDPNPATTRPPSRPP